MNSREAWEESEENHLDSILMTRGDILSAEAEELYYPSESIVVQSSNEPIDWSIPF